MMQLFTIYKIFVKHALLFILGTHFFVYLIIVSVEDEALHAKFLWTHATQPSMPKFSHMPFFGPMSKFYGPKLPMPPLPKFDSCHPHHPHYLADSFEVYPGYIQIPFSPCC